MARNQRKTAVVGACDRQSAQVRAEVVAATDKQTLHAFAAVPRRVRGSLNQRGLDTRDQMEALAGGLVGERLTYPEWRGDKQAS